MQQKNIKKGVKDKAKDIKEWRDEHGRPSLAFLQSLADEESPGSLEKLRAIAQDLNVHYSQGTSTQALIDRILAEVRANPTITT